MELVSVIHVSRTVPTLPTWYLCCCADGDHGTERLLVAMAHGPMAHLRLRLLLDPLHSGLPYAESSLPCSWRMVGARRCLVARATVDERPVYFTPVFTPVSLLL